MSTTFDVYPGRAGEPTCGALLRRAEERLGARLDALGVRAVPKLVAEVHRDDESTAAILPDDAPLLWSADSYLWIRLEGVAGGTDGHLNRRRDFPAHPRREELLKGMDDEIIDAKRLPEDFVRRCLDVGQSWWFRRSIGQTGAVNLAYGFVAAALAELTGGFLWSSDGAWDSARFPARAEDFYDWYFVPDVAIDPGKREWAERCIAGLEEELRGSSR